MSRKRRSSLLIGCGAALLIGALALLGWRWQRGAAAQQTRASVLVRLEGLMPEDDLGLGAPAPADAPQAGEHPPMATLELDGHSYIGIIEIPAIDLRLPVLSSGADGQPSAFPFRREGSAADGSLVVRGSDDPAVFGHLQGLSTGDEVNLRLVDGTACHYRISETASPALTLISPSFTLSCS